MNLLLEKFIKLPRCIKNDEFEAISLHAGRQDFLVKGANGEPIFLLHDSSTSKYRPGLNLRYVTTEFQATCAVTTNGTRLIEKFAIISCEADALELHEMFISCVNAAAENLPKLSNTDELQVFINDLLDIFRSFSEPGKREISGLWAELWVISNSGDIGKCIKHWHVNRFESFDFSGKNLCIEIKSTVFSARIHKFSLSQLEPPHVGDGFVISLLLREHSGGVGVLGLARIIEASLPFGSDMRKKLWRLIAASLGNDFADAIDVKYDLAYALKNAMVFRMDEIPSVGPVSNSLVSNVKFSSDLSGLPQTISGPAVDIVKNLFLKIS